MTDRLADRFTVLAPDRPGYGATAGEAQGIAANADSAAALVEMSGTVRPRWWRTAGPVGWPS